jgi:hypothetical protein
VDVSNTIESLGYNAQRASLLQRRPSTIIDVAESFNQFEPMHFFGGGEIIGGGSYRTSTKLPGATRTFLFVDTSALLATSATQIVTVEDCDMDSWAGWAKASNAALQKPTTAVRAAPSAIAKLRVNRLAALQAALGLSTSDLAQVLALSRPGLYKWLDISSDVKLQESSRERLAVIERIATQWRERSTAPLSTVAREPLADGRTVFSMLAAEQVNAAAVLGAYDELIAKLAGKPKSRSQKLTDTGFKRRPSARSLTSDE